MTSLFDDSYLILKFGIKAWLLLLLLLIIV